MKTMFSFFVRLFISFLVAKFILDLWGAATPGRLMGLSLVFLSNTYLFDLLDWYYEGAWRRALRPGELGWLMTRLSVMVNTLRRRPPAAGPSSGSLGNSPPRDLSDTPQAPSRR
jgi:hypothetical protein